MSDAALIAEVRRLRDEVADLRVAFRLLKRVGADDGSSFPPDWRLNSQERKVLALLRDHGHVPYARFSAHLWAETPDRTRNRHISKLICTARRKAGVVVQVVFGEGYEISAREQAILREARVRAPEGAG